MKTKVTISNKPQVITVNSGGVNTLTNLSDVNFNNATDGAVLQYDEATNTWIAENVLEKSAFKLIGGNF